MLQDILRPGTKIHYLCDDEPVFFTGLSEAFAVFSTTQSEPPELTKQAPFFDIAWQIAHLLVHDRKNRFGPTFDEKSFASVRERVEQNILAQEPISLTVMWGGLKHYVPDSEQGIDLAEFYALLQFAKLNALVKNLYPQGLHITFFLEDFGVWYEDAHDFPAAVRLAIEKNIETYVSQFRLLLKNIGDWGSVKSFFELLPNTWKKDELIQMADHHRWLLSKFWNELILAPPETAAEHLDSYQNLLEIGWSGTIPTEMRTHYLKRMTKLYPDETTDQHVDRILRYFAMVLLYQRVKILQHSAPSTLKVALYKAAPGILEQRTNGRIHMRTLPASVTSTVMPPWTCKGCIVLNSNGTTKLTTHSFLLAREQKSRFKRGRLKLSTTVGEIEIRGDLKLTDSMPGGVPLVLQQDLQRPLTTRRLSL